MRITYYYMWGIRGSHTLNTGVFPRLKCDDARGVSRILDQAVGPTTLLPRPDFVKVGVLEGQCFTAFVFSIATAVDGMG